MRVALRLILRDKSVHSRAYPPLFPLIISLHSQVKKIGSLDFEMHIVIILDGWAMVSDSMKSYCQVSACYSRRLTTFILAFPCLLSASCSVAAAVLLCGLIRSAQAHPGTFHSSKTMFDMPENVERQGPTWWNDLDQEEDNPVVETFVIQSVDTGNWTAHGVYIDPDSEGGVDDMLNVSLVIKRDNRRKHNTLEWFFRSFALELGAECESNNVSKEKDTAPWRFPQLSHLILSPTRPSFCFLQMASPLTAGRCLRTTPSTIWRGTWISSRAVQVLQAVSVS